MNSADMHGADVVMLHGWGFPAGLLAPLANALARRRVTLVDLPGYGDRAWRDGITDLDALALSITEAVPDGAAVIGWSLGGLVALALAATRDVESLVLIGSTPRFTAAGDWPWAAAASDLERMRRRLAVNPARCVDEFAVLAARGDARGAGVLRALRAASPLPEARALRAGLDILGTADLRAALRAIDVPALIVAGERDGLVPPAAARFLAGELPRGELRLLPGAAHAPFIGREAALAGRIEGFLAAHARARA